MYTVKKYIKILQWIWKYLLHLPMACNMYQGCIYLIKNKVKTVILWNIITIKTTAWIYCNVIYSCVTKLNFQHYSSLLCHMIFRNHTNMLICTFIIGAQLLIMVIMIINAENLVFAA